MMNHSDVCLIGTGFWSLGKVFELNPIRPPFYYPKDVHFGEKFLILSLIDCFLFFCLGNWKWIHSCLWVEGRKLIFLEKIVERVVRSNYSLHSELFQRIYSFSILGIHLTKPLLPVFDWVRDQLPELLMTAIRTFLVTRKLFEGIWFRIFFSPKLSQILWEFGILE